MPLGQLVHVPLLEATAALAGMGAAVCELAEEGPWMLGTPMTRILGAVVEVAVVGPQHELPGHPYVARLYMVGGWPNLRL